MKAKRQAALLNIIRTRQVETQEDLTGALSEAGFAVTQATVSRDIKELRLIKTLGVNGRYSYSEASAVNGDDATSRLHSLFCDAVTNVDFAGNIVVVKCISGTAGAVCTAADSMKLPSIVGSLAGDDTILFVVRTEEASAELAATFRELAAR